MEQAWKAYEPFVVGPAHADVHPQVIFRQNIGEGAGGWAKRVVSCCARSTSNEAQLWEPTAPHLQIDSSSLLHVRDGVLNVCIPDDSNVCACCQTGNSTTREHMNTHPWPPHGGQYTSYSTP